ncbi:5-oxoprolinase subunit PxpB [Alicyclobacillus sp. ALC3]|nr:5-oxoprolinase subunit PxpB [Alicyclobacillus sp. ALC3]
MGASYPSFTQFGDEAILVRFGRGIDLQVHRQIRQFCTELAQCAIPGVIECVPAYDCASVVFNPDVVRAAVLVSKLETIVRAAAGNIVTPARVVEIPVCYGGNKGPDLAYVANRTGMTEADVIAIHSAPDYTVYMIGFAPGFPYLGGMDTSIAVPRKATPRPTIPAGSVGIAGAQTGVYPLETPGGWQLIGRTPLRLFDPVSNPPTLLRAGDVVRFRAISEDEYHELCGASS